MKLFKKTKNEEENARSHVPNAMRAERYRYHSNRQDVDAYNRGRSEPSRVARFPWTAKAGYWLVIFGLVACALYSLWLSSVPEIKSAEKQSALLRDKSVYQAGAADILNNSLLSHSKLTINSERIATEFTRQFPEIARATVIIPLASHEPILNITPKEPNFILKSEYGAFVVDESGKILMKLSELERPDSYNLPTVIDQSGLEVEAGNQVVTEATVAFIQHIVYQFDQAKQPIDRMVLPLAPNELRVYPRGKSFFVKFDVTRDARLQAGSFFAVRNTLEAQAVTPAEYIDVRVSEKAYYK